MFDSEIIVWLFPEIVRLISRTPQTFTTVHNFLSDSWGACQSNPDCCDFPLSKWRQKVPLLNAESFSQTRLFLKGGLPLQPHRERAFHSATDFPPTVKENLKTSNQAVWWDTMQPIRQLRKAVGHQ
jgi:hypothetical protein